MATEQIQQPNEGYEPPRQIDAEEYLRLTATLPGKYEYAGVPLDRNPTAV